MNNDSLAALSQSVLAGAACAAGVWTLFNFGLSRAARPMINSDLKVNVLDSDASKNKIIMIEVTSSNSGRTGMRKKFAWIEVRPSKSPNFTVPDLQIIRADQASPPKKYSIFENHTYLEPGETFSETILLAVAEGTQFATIRMMIAATRSSRAWFIERTFDFR